MIQDIFTSQLVAELLDWRVLFGVLALYRRGHVHHVDGTLRELIYYTKPLAVSARRRVMDGVETTDELLLSAGACFTCGSYTTRQYSSSNSQMNNLHLTKWWTKNSIMTS